MRVDARTGDPVLHVGATVFVACCTICHELVIGDPPAMCPGCESTRKDWWLRGTAEVTDVR